MQAKKITVSVSPYYGDMNTGRPAKGPRPPFGERLHALREVAGLSQQQLAERVGISQAAYAWWERRPVALRPDQIQKLADALGVSFDALIGNGELKKRGAGPVGKMRKIFEEASKLPRSQQRQISTVVEALVAQHSNGRASS